MTRILVAANTHFYDRPSGSARIAQDLAHGLVGHGHQIDYLCMALDGVAPGVEQAEGMRIIRYRRPRLPFGFARDAQHAAAIRSAGARHIKESPAVVHGHTPYQFQAAARLFPDAMLCYTSHSPSVDEMKATWGGQGLVGRLKVAAGARMIRRVERACLAMAQQVTVLSHYSRDLLVDRYGVDLSERVQVVAGWTDLTRFAPLDEPMQARRSLGWPTDRPVLFALRRLEPRMGLANLLRAARLTRERGHLFHVVIGGEGSQAEQLVRLRDRLDLANWVSFVGRVSEERLPLAYGAADAFVLPSAELECFGIIALEALACGRPVLATPVAALPEVVSQFEPRWLAPDPSPEGIADIMCRFLRGELPSHAPDELRAIIRRAYSFDRGLAEYERLLSLGNGGVNE